jgi:hypothetical protein
LVGAAATFDSSEGAAKAMANQAVNVSLNISIVRKRVRRCSAGGWTSSGIVGYRPLIRMR